MSAISLRPFVTAGQKDSRVRAPGHGCSAEGLRAFAAAPSLSEFLLLTVPEDYKCGPKD